MKKLLLFFFILELCVAFSSVRQDFLYFSQDGYKKEIITVVDF